MNSENSKTSDPHKLIFNFADQTNLNRSNKYIALLNLSICNIWKNIIESYKNHKFKISSATLNNEFELPNGSHSISKVKVCFEYIIKKHEYLTDNPPVQIYINQS